MPSNTENLAEVGLGLLIVVACSAVLTPFLILAFGLPFATSFPIAIGVGFASGNVAQWWWRRRRARTTRQVG